MFGLTNEQLTAIGVIAGVVSAVITAIGLPLAVLAWRNHLIDELTQNPTRRDRMGRALGVSRVLDGYRWALGWGLDKLDAWMKGAMSPRATAGARRSRSPTRRASSFSLGCFSATAPASAISSSCPTLPPGNRYGSAPPAASPSWSPLRSWRSPLGTIKQSTPGAGNGSGRCFGAHKRTASFDGRSAR
jgi:hypothetical protein